MEGTLKSPQVLIFFLTLLPPFSKFGTERCSPVERGKGGGVDTVYVPVPKNTTLKNNTLTHFVCFIFVNAFQYSAKNAVE